jgi:hypothetical protein
MHADQAAQVPEYVQHFDAAAYLGCNYPAFPGRADAVEVDAAEVDTAAAEGIADGVDALQAIIAALGAARPDGGGASRRPSESGGGDVGGQQGSYAHSMLGWMASVVVKPLNAADGEGVQLPAAVLAGVGGAALTSVKAHALEQAMLALLPQEATVEVQVLGALLLPRASQTPQLPPVQASLEASPPAQETEQQQQQQQQEEEEAQELPPKRRAGARSRNPSKKAAQAVGTGAAVVVPVPRAAPVATLRGRGLARISPLTLLTSGDVGAANEPLVREPAFDSTQVTQRARLLLAVAQRAAGEDVAAAQAAVWNCDEHCIPSAAVPAARHFLAAYNSSDLRLSQQQQHVAMRNTSADVVGDGECGNRRSRSRSRSVTPQAVCEQPSPPPQQQDAGAPIGLPQSPLRLLAQLVHTASCYDGPEMIHLANATSKVSP